MADLWGHNLNADRHAGRVSNNRFQLRHRIALLVGAVDQHAAHEKFRTYPKRERRPSVNRDPSDHVQDKHGSRQADIVLAISASLWSRNDDYPKRAAPN
jgi:hypothetical protein